jgi:hypothetical protein
MGILEFVNNEHAGLIPRATYQIFEFIQNERNADINVSISFLQLYRETIQDLLSPASGEQGENLQIREDPVRGFYVEGLQEFAVRNYGEAEALINLGLENRAIAPTLMNATSSRSHIVLTINIEQKIFGEGTNYSKTLRSKLLMVDLAGSERVRRTISKGTRLSEAKSINTSLSALGNVIAALAEQNATHIPYRDSKLTRLLQDSLGGTASTALIATIGPAAVNYGETLSTLLFAQRCMAVKITPIPHEEVDYAEMCAKLTVQLQNMEGIMTEKLVSQQEMYEAMIRNLTKQLEDEKLRLQEMEYQTNIHPNGSSSAFNSNGALANNNNQAMTDNQELFNQELYQLFVQLEKFDHEEGEVIESSWLRKPATWSPSHESKDLPNGQLVSLLAYSYELIKYLMNELAFLIKKNQKNEDIYKETLSKQFENEINNEKEREWELSSMAKNDPRYVSLVKAKLATAKSKGIAEEEVVKEITEEQNKLAFHLAPLTHLEALTRVEGQFRSNNVPISQFDRDNIFALPISEDSPFLMQSLYNYDSIQEVAIALINLRNSLTKSLQSVHITMDRKDFHYKSIKNELTNQLVEKRKREEEVINWSYILKYLLASSSKLRKELNREKRVQSKQQTGTLPVNKKNKKKQKNQFRRNETELDDEDYQDAGEAEDDGRGKEGRMRAEDISMHSDIDKFSLNESIIGRLENTILNSYGGKISNNKNSTSMNSLNEKMSDTNQSKANTNNDHTFIPFAANMKKNKNNNEEEEEEEQNKYSTSINYRPPLPAGKRPIENKSNVKVNQGGNYKKKAPSEDDSESNFSISSDQLPPPPPPRPTNLSVPSSSSSTQQHPNAIPHQNFKLNPSQANNEALERVKLRLQMTQKEIQQHQAQPLPPGFVQQHSHRKEPLRQSQAEEEEEGQQQNNKRTNRNTNRSSQRTSIQSKTSVGMLFNDQRTEDDEEEEEEEEEDENEEEPEEEENEVEENNFENEDRYQQPLRRNDGKTPSQGSHPSKSSVNYNNNQPSTIKPPKIVPNQNLFPVNQSFQFTPQSQHHQQQHGYDEERFSENGSEYSLTSTTRSFRSAATPNSIPMPRYRKSKRKEASRQQQQQQQQQQRPVYHDFEEQQEEEEPEEEEEEYGYQERPSLSAINSRPNPNREAVSVGSAAAARVLPQNRGIPSSGHHPVPSGVNNVPGLSNKPILSNSMSNSNSNNRAAALPPPSSSNPLTAPLANPAAAPSQFAQEIVRNLGVQGAQAMSVMSVIDRVKDISPEQLTLLDEETRNQIVQIRKDLGIDDYILSNEQRRMAAEMHHIQRTRSSSNPRSAQQQQQQQSQQQQPPSMILPSSAASHNHLRPSSAPRSRSTTPTQLQRPPPALNSNPNSANSNRSRGSQQQRVGGPARHNYRPQQYYQNEDHDEDDDDFSQVDLMS